MALGWLPRRWLPRGGVSGFWRLVILRGPALTHVGAAWEEEEEEEQEQESGRTKAAGGSGPGGAGIDLLAHLLPRLLDHGERRMLDGGRVVGGWVDPGCVRCQRAYIQSRTGPRLAKTRRTQVLGFPLLRCST